MALKFTAESFLNLVRQSRLLDQEQLDTLLVEFEQRGVDVSKSRAIADALVEADVLTAWQVDKLMKGKHKGFFLGKYRLQELLGKGGMSSVYLADHVLMRRRCAIKVLPHKRVNDSSYLARFHREAQAVASLDHPNIVRAYDVDREVDGETEIHFLVMEHVDGLSLQELVNERGHCEFRKAAEYIRQSAMGLGHAHGAGLVHRDVKPGNLLVDFEGVVKILDLGLARFFEDEEENPITLRHDEKVLGTADYLAPEQALDSHGVDARADIYSLGCTFYFLLTGHPPFTEGTLAQRLMWHQTRAPAPIIEDRPDVPQPLVEIVDRMIAKDPDGRFQVVTEVADHLAAWLEGRPAPPLVSASTPPVARPVSPPGSSEPASPPVAVPVARPVKPPSIPAGEAVTPEVPMASTPVSEASETGDGLDEFLASLGDDEPAASVSTPSEAPAVTEAVPDVAADAEAETGFPDLDTDLATSPAARRRSSSRRQKPSKSGNGMIIGLSVAAVAILGLIVAAVFLFSGEAEKPAGKGGDEEKTAKNPTSKKGKAIPKTAAPRAKKLLKVGGPESEYETIAAALQYVQSHHADYRGAGRRIQVTIEVLGDETYAESIVIDGGKQSWPTGIAIVNSGLGLATLAPAGSDPIIRLHQVEYVQVRGFHLQAAGRPVAIVLAGGQDRVQLQQLTVEGFSRSGVRAEGVAGEPSQDVLQLQDLLLKGGNPQAVGLQFAKGVYPTANVKVHRCRVIGPLAVGIQLDDSVSSMVIQESVIQGAQVGLQLAGKNRTWKRVTMENITFFQVTRGIVFEQMPGENSDGVVISRNLFAEQRGPECVVDNGYNELNFSRMMSANQSIAQNWSSRQEEADGKQGERELMLPNPKRQRGVSVKFSSVESGSPEFLVPQPGVIRGHVGARAVDR